MEKNPTHCIHIHGDSNVNSNNKERVRILKHFMINLKLKSTLIAHKTYHHFLGNGVFDSNIDVLVCSRNCSDESIMKIFCKTEYPFIESHHDLILSSFSLPLDHVEPPPPCLTAPLVPNDRRKTIWSPENVPKYQELISKNLASLRLRWLNPKSRSSVSLLLKLTSEILAMAAATTNETVDLSKPRKIRTSKIPLEIRKSQRRLKEMNRNLKRALRTDFPVDNMPKVNELKDAKCKHRRLVRKNKDLENFKIDEQAFSIFTSSSSSLYRKIKAMKSSTTEQIHTLKVGENEYH